jgi:polysaccharide biosynthesis protein PslH
MSAAPHILLVAPMHSHPPDQGNAARLVVFSRALRARGASVELLYYGLEGIDPRREAAMRAAWGSFHYVPPLPHAAQRHPAWWGLDDWCPATLCEQVAELHRANRYQAVIANYVWLSRVLEGVDGTLRVIDTHDLFGNRHHVARRDGIEPSWYFTSLAEEARGLARADLVLAIQEEEAEALRHRTERPVLTLGHSPELRFLHRPAATAPLAHFGYLGSGNPWNLLSVQALDAALADAPDLDWLLAGGILSNPALRLRSRPLRLAEVQVAAGFYTAVDCVLNPMQGGTGLKIKTVEALGFGAPILGTHDAFAGLGAEHPAHQAEDAAALVPLMREYLANAGFRQGVALAGRLLALHYAAAVERQYDTLMALIGG